MSQSGGVKTVVKKMSF